VNGTVTEKYLWQGLTRLLAVYDGNDSLLMRFEYADARMPVAMTAGGVKYYLAYDQTGTLKAVADESGTVVLKRVYDSFGNILNEESSLPFQVPFGFAGGLYDKDTGLVRFGYRDYDPETGRWTAKDPILFAGGDTDLYGYCVNDPVNLLDPTGEIAHILGGIVGGAVGGAIVGGIFGAIKAVINDQDIGSAVLQGTLIGAVTGGIAGGYAMAGVPYIPAASQAFGEGYLYGLWGTKFPSGFSLFVNILIVDTEAFGENSVPCP
jgi:RHS repeat-associated protein